ncbi:copper resistance protein CopC [Aeromicrobium camelliae]|uniref:Copper resistance protein CopC n=1 Tax=Aeromicrobium camelliae TaxID=1538144 RepID=A0A3N6ZL11_9ACTN|nr:copper resistance CopC family protein [Aeromicrobium camelliae]RQN07707.1 copper resistance protein CopC [Aeromicrobium camelliae]
MSAACRRFLSVLALASAMVLMLAPGANAHAALVGVDPEEGAQLDAMPEQVTFTFSEDMREPAFASVVVDGRPVSLPAGDPTIDGADVIVDLAGVTTEGRDWTVSYRVVSADGHTVEGSTNFTIPSADVNDEPIASAEDEGSGSIWSSPWLWVAAVVVLAVLALLLVRGRRAPSSNDAA